MSRKPYSLLDGLIKVRHVLGLERQWEVLKGPAASFDRPDPPLVSKSVKVTADR